MNIGTYKPMPGCRMAARRALLVAALAGVPEQHSMEVSFDTKEEAEEGEEALRNFRRFFPHADRVEAEVVEWSGEGRESHLDARWAKVMRFTKHGLGWAGSGD